MLFIRYRKIIIGVIAILTILSGYFVTQVYFHHDLDRFLPKDRDDHQFLTRYQAQLESDDNYYLIAFHREQGIFQQKFLTQLDSFAQACKSINFILDARAITQLSYPIKTPFGFTNLPAIHLDNPALYAQDSIRLVNDLQLRNRFISSDGKTTLVLLKTEEDLAQPQAEKLDFDIKTLLRQFDFPEWHVAGKVPVQTAFIQLMQAELIYHIIFSNIVLLFILTVIFRRFWTIVIALSSVVLGAVFFAGLLGFLQQPLDLMSMLFPPLMLIVGMSDVVHFMSKYIDEIQKGKSKEEAITLTVKEIGWATFLTSVTTAVGFCALYFSIIEPIQVFGMTAAVGVFIAYLTVLLFTTSVLTLIDPEKIIPQKTSHQFWRKLMHRNFLFVQRNVPGISVISLLVIGVSFYGLSIISTNAHVLSDVPANSEVMEDVRFFERELAGIRSFEMAILPQGEKSILDFEVLQEVDKLEKFIAQETTVNSVSTPTSIFKALHRSHRNNNSTAFKLPEKESDWRRYRKLLKKYASNETNILYSKDEKLGRFTGRMVDIGSDSIRLMNQKINNWIDQNIDAELVTFRATGTSLVIDKNNEYLRTSLTYSLWFALITVSILMSLLFKDIRLVVVSLFPNIIPLIITAGIIGFLGIELNGSVSIIFAIAFGIAVDDTIHFLSKFKLERDQGRSIRESIYRTYLETGKAINLTSIILFFGFGLLIFSNFNGVFYVGLLISLTLLAALAACLLLIPIFILYLLGGYKEAPIYPELPEEDGDT